MFLSTRTAGTSLKTVWYDALKIDDTLKNGTAKPFETYTRAASTCFKTVGMMLSKKMTP
jgi:hypothetical protein